MKSGTGEVRMSPGMAYWSVIQPELVVECTGVGVVVTVDSGGALSTCHCCCRHVINASGVVQMVVTVLVIIWVVMVVTSLMLVVGQPGGCHCIVDAGGCGCGHSRCLGGGSDRVIDASGVGCPASSHCHCCCLGEGGDCHIVDAGDVGCPASGHHCRCCLGGGCCWW